MNIPARPAIRGYLEAIVFLITCVLTKYCLAGQFWALITPSEKIKKNGIFGNLMKI